MKALSCFSLTLAALAWLALSSPVAPQPDIPQDLPRPVVDADFYDNGAPPLEKVELGRLLFFDKILSGNQNIACATCHHPRFASADGVALAFGEGAAGLGPLRRTGTTEEQAVHERVPRNSPALFNLGARQYTTLFHDGRVEVDTAGFYEGGFITPAKWKLPPGLDNVLAAQAMFPVTSPTEMAGQKGENPLAEARSLNNVAGPGGVWEQLAARLQAIPEYVQLFREAFPDQVQQAEDITMVQAANAIAAFEAKAFRADESPFDAYLRTGSGLSPEAERGMRLFYGKAQCQTCHSGAFQTDHDFHAIAMPQIGPGKADGRDGSYWRETGVRAFVEDFGRGRETVRGEDNYKFRTPSLRNVSVTGPWGHAGAYGSLEAVVRHHLDPVGSLEAYALDEEALPELEGVLETRANGPAFSHRWVEGQRLVGYLARDGWVQQSSELRGRIAAANELEGVALTNEEVGSLLAFLESLTDERWRRLEEGIPTHVPSGLPVID